MVINSYHAGHPWVADHNGALTRELAEKADLSFHYLDTKRIPASKHPEIADRLFATAKEKRPVVVVLTDDNAVRMLGMRLMGIGIPVVFLGVNENPRTYLGRMDLATGVLERPLFKRSLIFLQDIVGSGLDRCLVLFDDSITSQVIRDTEFSGRSLLMIADVETRFEIVTTFDQWKELVLTAKDRGNDILFAGLYHTLVDAEGGHVPSEDVIRWTSAHSPVPVFAYWDFAVGKGKAVGGLVNSGKIQGSDAARLVRQILSGRSPHTIYPVISEYGDFVFSQHELKRWGLVVPPGLASEGEPVFFVE